MTLPPERQRDLVAELITPWVPVGGAEEARFTSAARRATQGLRAPFALAQAHEIGESSLLITNPDGSKAWTSRFGFTQPPAAAATTSEQRGQLAATLLTIWKQLFVDVRGEYGFLSVRGEVNASKVSMLRQGLPDMLWVSLFGPRVVKALGEQVLTALPADRVERLEGGGLVVIRDPDPWAWNKARARRRRAELRARVGEAFFVRRSWLSGKFAPARKAIDLGARSLSPQTITVPAARYLGGEPATLFAQPDARRRELAALLHTTVGALGCGVEQAEGWDEQRPWDDLADDERAPWVAPLAFHLGDCVARSLGGTWAVHPELHEPVVALADGRFLRPLVEAQDIVFDEGRMAEVLARAGTLRV